MLDTTIWQLYEYWFYTIRNIFIIIYTAAIFEDQPLFEYQRSVKPWRYVKWDDCI